MPPSQFTFNPATPRKGGTKPTQRAPRQQADKTNKTGKNAPAADTTATPAKPPPPHTLATFDWAAAADEHDSAAAKPSTPQAVDLDVPDEAGAPPRSSIELRVFGLPGTTDDSAMTAFKAILADINNRDGKTYAIDDDGYVDPSDLDVSLGDPVGFSKQTSVTVRVSGEVWYRKDVDIIAFLDGVRLALKAKKCEVFWSCAQRNDKRTAGVFTFHIDDGSTDDITAPDARKAVTALCKAAGHPVSSAFAVDFHRARLNDKPPQVTVKFVHVASVSMFPSAISETDMTIGAYKITYGPCLSVIPTKYPTTLASPHKAEVPEHALRQELKKWIKKFNRSTGANDGLMDQGEMVHGRYFVVTPTSMALAEYIASQECQFGFPYELAYDLNDRSLVPAMAAAERDRNMQERMTTETSAGLAMLSQRLDAADKAQQATQRTMVTLQHTMRIMASDNRKNHRALLEYQQKRDALRDEQNSVRFKLADIKGDVRAREGLMHPLRVQLIEYSVDTDNPAVASKRDQYNALLNKITGEVAKLEAEQALLEKHLADLDEQSKMLEFVDYVDNTMLINNDDNSVVQPSTRPDTTVADNRRFEILGEQQSAGPKPTTPSNAKKRPAPDARPGDRTEVSDSAHVTDDIVMGDSTA